MAAGWLLYWQQQQCLWLFWVHSCCYSPCQDRFPSTPMCRAVQFSFTCTALSCAHGAPSAAGQGHKEKFSDGDWQWNTVRQETEAVAGQK